LNINYMHFM